MTNQLQGVSAEMSNKILNYVNAKAKTPEERQAMINDMLPEAVAYEKKQQRKAGRETYKSQLREKIAQETKTEPSNQLKIWLRTANLADMVRDYAEKNGGNTQWLDDDKELLNRFLAKNPNQAKSVQRYMNGEISNVELWKRLWFITYDDATWEQAGISEEKEEWPWFWAQVGQAGKDIVWGVYDSVTGIGKLAGKGLGNAVARTAKKFWADEQKVDGLNQSWKDSLDGKNNLWLGTDVGQDKDAFTYKASNTVADLAQVAAPGGIVRAGAKGLQLANTSTKVGEVLAKAFPKVANVISKSEKGADFVVGLLNKTGGKINQLTQKLPILWKILKGGFEWVSDTVLFNAVNGEGTDLKDASLGAGIWGAFPVVWKMLWWLGGKAKNLIWKTTSKLELSGNLNPAKLEAVQKQLIEEGTTLPGKATPEDVGKWMLERGFKGSKGDLITQLNAHAQKSKAMVDELLWLSNSTHKVEEVNQALQMLAKDYSTTPWLTKKADEILGLMKDEYTLSEMNQVKRYMDEAYNMFKQNGGEVAGLKAEGLRNIRKEIKTTIENVAEQEGLGNIRMLNNETQVARGLAEGIAKKEEAGILRQVTSPFSSIRNGAILGGIGGGIDPRDSWLERIWNIAKWAILWGILGSTKAKTTLANMLKKLGGIEKKEITQRIATNGATKLSEKSAKSLSPMLEKVIEEWDGNIDDLITNTQNTTPKTVSVWVKSKFSDKWAYKEVPVIREVKDITLYQWGKWEWRQFWTENKKYAAQFGEIQEKRGNFYEVDNGNRMTKVYVEMGKSSTKISKLIWNSLENNYNWVKPNRLNGERLSIKEAETLLTKSWKNLKERILIGIDKNWNLVLEDGRHLLEAYRILWKEIPSEKLWFNGDKAKKLFEQLYSE